MPSKRFRKMAEYLRAIAGAFEADETAILGLWQQLPSYELCLAFHDGEEILSGIIAPSTAAVLAEARLVLQTLLRGDVWSPNGVKTDIGNLLPSCPCGAEEEKDKKGKVIFSPPCLDKTGQQASKAWQAWIERLREAQREGGMGV